MQVVGTSVSWATILTPACPPNHLQFSHRLFWVHEGEVCPLTHKGHVRGDAGAVQQPYESERELCFHGISVSCAQEPITFPSTLRCSPLSGASAGATVGEATTSWIKGWHHGRHWLCSQDQGRQWNFALACCLDWPLPLIVDPSLLIDWPLRLIDWPLPW